MRHHHLLKVALITLALIAAFSVSWAGTGFKNEGNCKLFQIRNEAHGWCIPDPGTSLILPKSVGTLLIGCLLSSSFAQETNIKNSELLLEAIESNLAVFQSIQSLKYKGQMIVEATPEGIAQYGSDAKYFRSEVNYEYAGDKFAFLQKSQSSESGPLLTKDVRYDGNHWQYLTTEGRLYISKTNRNDVAILRGSNLIFSPLEKFVPIVPTEGIVLLDQVSDYANSETWKRLIKDVTSVDKVRIGDKDLIKVVSVMAKRTPVGAGYPVELETFFSPSASFYPISCRIIDKNSGQETQFDVIELGKRKLDNGLTFYFPIRAVILDLHNQKILRKATLDINEVELNLPSNDDAFTIDVTSARRIHDMDNCIIDLLNRIIYYDTKVYFCNSSHLLFRMASFNWTTFAVQ